MVFNFNSGPAILPEVVLKQAAEGIIDFKGSGLSILEIGHRSPMFMEVMSEARSLVLQLMGLGDEYSALFLQGGATAQFMQVPANLLDHEDSAAYCDDGTWGNKAYKEAMVFGKVAVVSSSQDSHYTTINESFSVDLGFKYLHITSNNTVEGTQWKNYPDTTLPLIADMSSDIFSKKIAFDKFSLIYAGAQKNLGAAGVTLVVVKKSLLGKKQGKIPSFLNYQKHIEAESLLNTPPVFSVYVTLLTLRWIINNGGLEKMEQLAHERAAILYNAIDNNPLFEARVDKKYRSLMNAVFFLKDNSLEQPFLEFCKNEGMVGVKGYRTVGGIRVSMYNAMPVSSVIKFTELMTYFAEKHN